VADVTVERVDPADAAATVALAALRRAWVEERRGPQDDPGFEAGFEAWWADEAPQRLAWLARVEGEPVGMVNLLEFTRMPSPGAPAGRWGYLGNAFVLARHRDAGIGRLLLDALVAEARARDYVRIVLSPSARSVPFYRRAGFRDATELLVLPLTPSGGGGQVEPARRFSSSRSSSLRSSGRRSPTDS
jgi:GNAT superfamily N-acetyltransferase